MATPEYVKPRPTISEDGGAYWEACRRHELQIQRCADCGGFQFPARVLCTHCGSRRVAAHRARGTGEVYAYTIVHRPPEPAFAPDVPYVVAVIQLDEGPRMMTNIVGCPVEQVHSGMNVSAVFDDVAEDLTLVKFTPVAK